MYQNEIKMDQNLSDQMQRLIRFAQRSFATSKMQTPPVFIKELAWRIEYDEGSDHPWSPVREPLGDEHKSAALLEYESNWAASRVNVPKQYHQYRSGASGHTYAAETRIEEQPALDNQKNGTDAKYSWRPPVSAAAQVTLNASPECAECATPQCNQDMLNHPDEESSTPRSLAPDELKELHENIRAAAKAIGSLASWHHDHAKP